MSTKCKDPSIPLLCMSIFFMIWTVVLQYRVMMLDLEITEYKNKACNGIELVELIRSINLEDTPPRVEKHRINNLDDYHPYSSGVIDLANAMINKCKELNNGKR